MVPGEDFDVSPFVDVIICIETKIIKTISGPKNEYLKRLSHHLLACVERNGTIDPTKAMEEKIIRNARTTILIRSNMVMTKTVTTKMNIKTTEATSITLFAFTLASDSVIIFAMKLFLAIAGRTEDAFSPIPRLLMK